jgi:hypothetical protein
MAPTPAPPKADGTSSRQRRNLGQRQWRTITRGVVPIPPMPGETTLTKRRRQLATEYWTALWTDYGVLYTDSDRHPIARLCSLHSLAMLGKLGAQAQGELRQLENNFGASPLARQRLQVQVQSAVEADGKPAGDDEPIDMAKQRERRARIKAAT